MGDALLTGKKPEVNDTKPYDNGVKVVPAYLLQPVSVDKTNYQKVLVDGGLLHATSSRRSVRRLHSRLGGRPETPARTAPIEGCTPWPDPSSRCARSSRPSPVSGRSPTST